MWRESRYPLRAEKILIGDSVKGQFSPTGNVAAFHIVE